MRKLGFLLLLFGACAPSIAQNPRPGPAIVAEFDPGATPPVVPSPNDLAIAKGRVAIPPSPGETAAQLEFDRDYLGALSGFPFESVVQASVSGPLDPTTVDAQSVVVFDVTTGVVPVTGLSPALDPTAETIVVAPPPGGWTRAHQYAVALIAGTGGLAGANGEPVVGSPTWALVSSPTPLVDCPTVGQAPDLTSPECVLAVDIIPSTETDPTARLQAQTQTALQLEQIREGYAPLLAAVAHEALTDASHIPLLWAFTIVDAGEVTFDPAIGAIPFPNDVLRNGGVVALPNPKTGAALSAADCAGAIDPAVALTCGLNTLDGFSTIAPPISTNAATDAVAQAQIDPMTSTLTLSVGLLALSSTAPAGEGTQPVYHGCLNCLSSPTPQQLEWMLDTPLDERTTYLAYVTNDLVDRQGKNVIPSPTFALVRSANPIAVDGKSQVNVLSDAQASELEPLRLALKPALDGLAQMGLARANVALAWAFTTQSEGALLAPLYGYVDTPPLVQTLPQGVVVFADATAQYTSAAAAGGIPTAAIAKFYEGVFETPVAVTGPGGTLDVAQPTPEPVTFALAIPAVQAPPAGYPIAIFGHGFTRDHNDFLAIANSLAAAGQATIAADVLFHGERSSCTGWGAYLVQLGGGLGEDGGMITDDDACADAATMRCNEDPLIGRCVAADPTTRIPCPGLGAVGGPDPTGNLGCQAANMGACVASDGKCEGGDFQRDASGRPIISGWNIVSLTNFFATRDNFRQGVIDLAQLVRVLRATGPTSLASHIAAAGGSATFDSTRIGYVGESLSGIIGTLFGAVSPDVPYVALNAPGGDLPQIILDAPSFTPQAAALLAGLAAQTPPILSGTPQFDQFISTVQWIVDPADPANLAWRLTHPVSVGDGGAAPANRATFIQFIEGDQVIPNAASTIPLVHAAAGASFSPTPPGYGCAAPLFCYEFTEAADGFDETTAPLSERHGFLLQPPSAQSAALTAEAQLQVATFLASGVLP